MTSPATMSSTFNVLPGVKVSRSTKLAWYKEEIGSSLMPAGRRLLEDYSHLDPEEVEPHIYKIRDIAWDIFPWPCVGGFWFVTLGLSLHPSYAALLDRFRAPAPTPKLKLLDVGTCLGQDLRKLIHDGVDPGSIYGTDIFPQYESVGHELFRDDDRFSGHFLVGDLFDEGADNSLVRTEGSWNVISLMMVLHIFDYDKQVRACRRVLKLLKRERRCLVIGAQVGSTKPGEQEIKPPFVEEGGKIKTLYRQSKETLVEMWSKVAKEEGIEIKMEAEYKEYEGSTRIGEAPEGAGQKYFSEGEDKRVFFTVEVV